MGIPIPAPSLTDQTSFGPNTASFGAVNYSPPPLSRATQSQSILGTQSLPLAMAAVAVAGVIYYKWGR